MKKPCQLSTEVQELKKNSLQAVEQQLMLLQKQKDLKMEHHELLNHLIIQQDVVSLESLFKKQASWRVKIQDSFVEEVLDYQEKSLEIFSIIKLIADGYFLPTTSQISATHLGLFQSYFICSTPENYSIFFEVGLTKKPKFKKQQFDGFKIYHEMTFLGIKQIQKMDDILKCIQTYHSSQNPYKQNFNEINCESAVILQNKQKYQEKQLFYWNEEEKWGELQFNQSDTRWLPTEMLPQNISENELKDYYFDEDLQQWITKQQKKNFYRMQQSLKKTLMNKNLLHQYADFASAAKIIEIMQMLPDFKIKITQQERDVIATKLNSLIIGRSGTGKTTCTVLRLFAIETLMKIRQKLFNQQNEMILQDSVNDGKKTGLHCIFTTQNPVLIGEVRKYYKKLLIHIQESIKRNQEKNNVCSGIQSLDESMISKVSFDDMINESSISHILQDEVLKDEPEEQLDEEEDELDNVDNLSSLQEMTEKEFPSFLSVKKLLFLIDASLDHPFFDQNRFKVNGIQLGRAGWNNGKTIKITKKLKVDNSINIIQLNEEAQFEEEEFTMMSQTELEQQMNETKLLAKQQADKQQKQKEEQQTNLQVVEVDYDYFLRRFWPTVKKQGHRQGADELALPTLIWTQIYSYIKGSQFSYSYPQQYLPKQVYTQLNPCHLSDDKIKLIYDYFLEYEKWKLASGVFDLMDLVNYLICEIDKGRFSSIPIHYLFVDEVQDLPHAVLELFSRMIEQGYYFCGDTAQNIVKGVGFRFQDLKNLFKHSPNPMLRDSKDFQLTVNFRSHNKILQVANSLVSLIELFFPKAIDRLNKEISDLNGPMPIVIQENDINQLFKFLTGDVAIQGQQAQQVPIEFGCNQVVLVKDQEQKNNIPSELEHALILTVYESKGLEFEDVILFNFFSDNNVLSSQWDLFNHLFIEEIEMDSQEFDMKLTKHEQQLPENDQTAEKSYVTNSQGKTIMRKLRLKPSIKAIDLNNFNALCNELKYLYVAVTRTKNRLIIFDEQPAKRMKIQNLWKEISLIEILDDTYYQKNQIQRITQSNTKEEWNQTGLKMLANKYYDQAAKCFEIAENQQLLIKSLAYSYAQKAEKKYFESQNFEEQSQDKLLPQNQRRAFKEKADKLLKECLNFFVQAGHEFVKCNLFRQGAACFFSGKQYQLSLQNYIIGKKWNEGGEAALQLKQYDVAGLLFLKGRNFGQCIDAFIQHGNNLIAFQLVCRLKNQIQDNVSEKITYLLPLVLKECFLEYNNIQKQQYIDDRLYQGKPCNFQFIENNCQDFENEFNHQLELFENCKVNVKNKDSFFQTFTHLIRLCIDDLLVLLSQVFINYPVVLFKHSVFNDSDESKSGRIKLLLDILEYFELRKIQLFLYDYINSNERDNFLISSLYYISPLYQPCFSFEMQLQVKELISKDKTKLKQYYEKTISQAQNLSSTFPIINSNKRLLTNYAISQLGFYEVGVENFNKRILEMKQEYQGSLTQVKIRTLISQVQDILMLFQDQSLFFQIFNQLITYTDWNYLDFLLRSYFQKILKIQYQQFDKIIDNLEKINFLNYSIKSIVWFSRQFYSDTPIDMKYFNYLLQNTKYGQEDSLMSKSIILALIPKLNNNWKGKLYKSLLNLEFEEFQLFIIELQKVVDLFKYNRRIEEQLNTFKCIQTIFQITLPTTETFKYLAQSYVSVHKQSIIFEYLANNYKQQDFQCFHVDIKGEVFLFSSTFVIKKIQSIYKQFLKKYVADYCHLKTQAQAYVPFLIKFYPFCVMKLYPQRFNTDDFVKQHFFQHTVRNQNLLNCLQHELCDEIFNLWYQIPKSTFQQNTDIYDELATTYFAKALSDQTKNMMHIHTLTAIHSLHVAQFYDKSLQFVRDLIKARKSNEYKFRMNPEQLQNEHPFLNVYELSCYESYIKYLIMSNICMSTNTILNYLNYHQGLLKSQILFDEQIFRDLTFCTLNYIICSKAFLLQEDIKEQLKQEEEEIKQLSTTNLPEEQKALQKYIDKLNEFSKRKTYQCQLMLPDRVSHFIQTKRQMNLHQPINISSWNQDDQIRRQLIQIILQLVEGQESQAITLLIIIIINLRKVPFQIAEFLEREGENSTKKKQFNLIGELNSLAKLDFNKRIHKVQNYVSEKMDIFKHYSLIEITYEMIEDDVCQKKLNNCLGYSYDVGQINYKLEYELKKQLKQTFKSQYIGMRFISFAPLMKSQNQAIIFDDEQLQSGGAAEIYDEINLIRSQLFEILYTKSLQKSVNYHSIIQELDKLSIFEKKLDQEFQKQLDDQYHNFSNEYWRKLKHFQYQIRKWIQDNNQLSGKFGKLENQIFKNQQKGTTTAMCILQKRRW